MKSTKMLCVLITAALLFTCASCTSSKQIEEPDIHSTVQPTIQPPESPQGTDMELSDRAVEEDDTRYISNYFNRYRAFLSLEDFYTASAYVVTGICISSRPVYQNETLYTISEIKIKETYSGEFKTDDIILVIEMGGRTTYGEYSKNCDLEIKAFETGQKRMAHDQKLVLGYDGYFPLQVDDAVLLFLGDDSGFIKEITAPLYGVLGGYDGKLFLQGDGSYAKPLPSSTDRIIFGDESLVITIDELNQLYK